MRNVDNEKIKDLIRLFGKRYYSYYTGGAITENEYRIRLNVLEEIIEEVDYGEFDECEY